MYESDDKIVYFTKKLKRSSVEVNCGFDNPAGMFPPEVRTKCGSRKK